MNILVLGIGNELCGDDGFGSAVVKEFASRSESKKVTVENGATGGLNLLWLMEDFDVVLVADAMKGIGKPGDIIRIEWSEVAEAENLHLSLHEIGLQHAVQIAKQAGWKVPKIVVFGAEPKTLAFGTTRLSPEVNASVAKVADMICEEIRKI